MYDLRTGTRRGEPTGLRERFNLVASGPPLTSCRDSLR